MAETFGAELRRLHLGESRVALARRTDIGVMALYLLEVDLRPPTRQETEALIAALCPPTASGNQQYLRELAFRARGECCPRCGFGGEE